jgi:hypothetical protein
MGCNLSRGQLPEIISQAVQKAIEQFQDHIGYLEKIVLPPKENR